MAPYAIAHLKLGLFLEETGYKFDNGKRLGVYLTNTLEDSVKKSETLFEEFIAEEASQATEIKHDEPVMVVIGNPPYSYESSNTGEWISNLVRDYYYLDGQSLNERNPKGLQDDYVKFIRFAQWRVEQTGHGILAFINNHGYIDNPTFRGMRHSLMKTFNEINILDLHGNTKKKEQSPDDSKDENVFDIQQGVSTGIFLKFPETNLCKVYHSELWGLREIYENQNNDSNNKNLIGGKYYWLLNNSINSTEKKQIDPQSNFYLFFPQNTDLLPEYEQGWKITDILNVNSLGIATARDSLTIQWNKKNIQNVINNFANLPEEEAREKYNLGKDTRDWKVLLAQQDLKESKFQESNFSSISYRPFDIRHTYYTGKCRGFHCMPRDNVMRHMKGKENISLCFIRRSREQVLSNFFVAKHIVDKTILSSADNANIALYLYPDTDNPQKSVLKEQRRPNFSSNFLNSIKEKLSYTPTPEAIFYYIYAVFHSPTYRDRYAEFLKIDFPRVPLTSNDSLFRQLADYGEQLVQLHLMASPKLNNLITEFIEEGDRTVAPGHPKYQDGAVQINKNGDKFTGVPESVWNFYVGGYQVCHKWLKDRKGRTLSDEDILHYQKIVVALKETSELMTKIDEAIPSFPIS